MVARRIGETIVAAREGLTGTQLYVTLSLRMSAYEAIADPTRRRILDLLREQPLPAGELASHFPVSRPAVSRHLRVLRRAGLVKETRQGRQRLYRLSPTPLRQVGAWVHEYERFWQEGLGALKRYLEEETDAARPTGRPAKRKE